jgi:hypothetical protein
MHVSVLLAFVKVELLEWEVNNHLQILLHSRGDCGRLSFKAGRRSLGY